MKHAIVNEKGMTLAELLASLAVLSIVLITFIGIFSRSMILSSKAEDHLTSINIAEKVLAEVKKNPPAADETSLEPITLNGKNYYPFVEVSQTDAENRLGLKRVLVKIYLNEHVDPETNPHAKIYGYIE